MRVFPNVYGPPCGTKAIHASAYLMIVGEHAFGLSGQFQRKANIADGLDCTIAVAETMATDTHWLSPNDFDLSKMSMRVNAGSNSISSFHSSGPAVLFCDGEVFRLNPSIDEDTLRALLTVDGGESISRDKLISNGLLLPP